MRKEKRKVIFLFLPLALFLVERLLRKEFLSSSLAFNNRLIFGLFDGPRLAITSIFVVTLLVLTVITVRRTIANGNNQYYRRVGGYLLLLAGALLNWFDLVFFNGIVDYLSFFGWWYLNIADLYIISGIILITIDAWVKKKI